MRRAHAAKVILIGLDGADWRIIDRLLTRGELPNLARLKSSGTYGRLRSAEPLLSPLIWTSIATGKPPEEHGIVDFLAKDPENGMMVPVTSSLRRVKALWNIVGGAGGGGMRVGFVGWLASWPAERVNGFIVTDRLGYHLFSYAGGDDLAGSRNTYPPGLLAELLPLRVRPKELGWKELSRFVRVPRDEFRGSVARRYTRDNPEASLRLLVATTETYRKVSIRLLKKHRPDMFGIYFEAIDTAGHLFMRYALPKRPDVTEAEFRKYGPAIDEVYRYQDEVLGDLLKFADAQTAVMVVSDHGFKSGERRPKRPPGVAGPAAAAWHELYGVFIASGYGVAKAGPITGATIFDVAPTVLALLGCQVPEDMKGKVLAEALAPNFLQGLPLRRIASYGAIAPAQGRAPVSSSADKAIVERLKALGYVAPKSAPELPSLPKSVYGLRTLATVYAKKKDYRSAIALYKRALELEPSNAAAVTDLGSVYLEMGLAKKAQRQFERAIALNPTLPEAYNNLGQALRDQGDLRGAAAAFKKALALEPKQAQVHANLGNLYRVQGRLGMAEQELAEAVKLDPDLSRARNNLGAVLLLQGKRDEALAQFKQVIAEDPGYALAHHNVGLIYLQKRKPREAEVELRRAVSLAPRYGMSRVYLAMAVAAQGRAKEAREVLRALLASPGVDRQVATAAREVAGRLSRGARRRLPLKRRRLKGSAAGGR